MERMKEETGMIAKWLFYYYSLHSSMCVCICIYMTFLSIQILFFALTDKPLNLEWIKSRISVHI